MTIELKQAIDTYVLKGHRALFTVIKRKFLPVIKAIDSRESRSPP